MAKMVTAYDTRTGEALPNPVPQSWLDNQVFAHLSATQPAPAEQPVSVPVDEPNDTWTAAQLRTHADRRGVDLAGATTKADILTALAAAPKES